MDTSGQFIKEVIDEFMGIAYKKDYKGMESQDIWDIMNKYYYWGFFTSNWDVSYAPVSAAYDFLGDRYGQNPIQLIKDVSYSQFKEMMEAAVWNMNEQSEEGKKSNQQKRLKNMTPEEKKKRDDQIEGLQNVAEQYFKNN